MSYDELNEEISEYQLSLFNPSKYVLPEYISKYDVGRQIGQFTQSDREHYLIGMMKVNFLKRLESSVHSFGITMGRTIEKIEKLEKRIKRFQEFRDENPDIDLEDVDIEALEDEDLQEAMQVGKKLIFKMAHLDTERWLEDLQHDREQLELPHLYAKDVTVDRDAKLAKLKKLIAKKVKQPTKNKEGKPNRKVLVFTAFADTAQYLYDALEQWATEELGVHIGMVSGGTSGNKTTFGRTEFSNILTNFSPKSKKRSPDENHHATGRGDRPAHRHGLHLRRDKTCKTVITSLTMTFTGIQCASFNGLDELTASATAMTASSSSTSGPHPTSTVTSN